jgi:two-component system, LytTR family, sensor histidine kinase AgrC
MVNNSIALLQQIISLLLGLFSTYIIFDFMSRFQRNLYNKKYRYVVGYILYTIVICVTSIYFTQPLGLIITIAATSIAGHFLYNNKKIYVFYYSIFIIFLSVFQVIAVFLFQMIVYYFNINFYSQDVFSITFSIIIQFANLSASRLFIICYKKKKIEKITRVQYLNFLVLPVFSIFYIITLMIYIQIYLSVEDIVLLLVSIVSIIVLNIFITNVFESISKNNELKSDLMLYEQQAKMQHDYYTSLEGKYNNTRKLIHDMKNHMQTIENLYNMNENEKAQQYTDDVYKLFDKFMQKHYTSNKVLNIIINDKIQRAESAEVTMKCEIGEVDLGFIKDIDQTTIFSNLLDNAIEGAKTTVEQKNIALKIDNFNDFIVINIANSINQSFIKDDNGFKSTKKNHKGFGLQNVKRALEKYEGNMRIDYDDKEFTVNIVIPNNQEMIM